MKHLIRTGAISLGFLLLVSPALALAQTTSVQSQIAALLAELQQLQAQIAQLQGQSVSTSSSCINLSDNLYAGETDAQTAGDVSRLQQFVGVNPTTGYFGPLTLQAVQNWQSSHGIVSSGTPDTTGYGFVGPRTIAAMACGGSQPITPSNPPTTSATINQSSLTTTSGTPTITGSASGLSTVYVVVSANNQAGHSQGNISVLNGQWSTIITPLAETTLPSGTYQVSVYSSYSDPTNGVAPLTTGTLTINTPQASVAPSCSINGPQSASVGQPFTISWTSTNASSADLEPIYGSVSVNGSEQVTEGNSGTARFVLSLSGSNGTGQCTAYISVSPSTSPSGTPAISVANVSGISITLQYSNMPPAALKVFNNTSSTPIWTQELNWNGSTSGTTSFTLPNGTPSGQYIIEATDANGNNYAGTAWFSVTNTAAVPAIAITAASTAISPAMSMAVQYNNMPAAGVHIIDASGATVWTQELTSGGGGSTVVSLSSVLPTGNYTAQAYGSNGTVYATSAPYHFTAPDLSFEVAINSSQSITLGMGQSASDEGIKITLASTATNSSGAAVANVNFAVTGAQPGFCSTASGGTLCGGGGFGDSASPTGGVSITVSSVSLQNNTVTVVINTFEKG
jgi:hypothetical protein